MPDEGGDGDEECGAHEKRGRQRRQVLEHRAPPFGPADLRVPATPAAAGLPPTRCRTCGSGQARSCLIVILADRAAGPAAGPRPGAPGDSGPEDYGCRPATRPPVSVARGSIGSAADAGRRRQTRPGAVRRGRDNNGERTTTVCSTPTCTSTPDSPAPAAGTVISNISHGGRAAKGSPCWARVTLRIQDGPMN